MDNTDLRLPKSNSATASGLRTTLYSTVTALIAFSSGLFAVLHGIPGCSEAVINYIQSNSLQLALMIGLPSGLISFAVGLLTPSKPNY